MISLENLKGTGTALVTPFDDQGKVDFDSLEKVIQFNIEGGIDYLVCLGTTGEAVTLSRQECQDILDFTLKITDQRIPVVFGVFGSNSTEILLERLEGYNLDGVDALLAASPYYNKPTQEGIFQHYKVLNDHTPLPVIIYNVPGRTASNIEAQTTLRIARELDKIIGIKEASANLHQINTILKYRPEDFLVISGDDPSTLAMMAHGADGVISVISNAYPHEWSDMVRACRNKDYKKAVRLFMLLHDLHDWLYVDGNPCGIKAALKNLQLIDSMNVRLPLVPMQKEHVQSLTEEMDKIKENATSIDQMIK